MEWVTKIALLLIEFGWNLIGFAIILAIVIALYKLAWSVISTVWQATHKPSYVKFIELLKGKFKKKDIDKRK